jgi:nucleoid-associated protein YgaU
MNKIQALFMGFATAAGAGGIAAYNGVFDSAKMPAAQVAQQQPAKVAQTPVEMAKVDPAAPAVEPAKPAETVTAAPAAADPVPPVFGLLRAEPDGSLLVAGQGVPGSQIELLSASTLLGKTKAEANGDFAIVLSEQLKPGDYSLVLRATNPDGKSANSVETATVSIPDQPTGQVLALVEEPGKASRIITAPVLETKAAPEPAKPAQVAAASPEPAPVAPVVETPAAPVAETRPATLEAAPAAEIAKAEAPVVEAAKTEAPAVTLVPEILVEAVELEGRKIFVAGKASKGSTIRLYANDILLGDAKAGATERFLLETEKDLPVGDYIIRADTLAADGVTVLSRAAVPFKREAGEVVAAVATPAAEPALAAETPAVQTPVASAEPSAPAQTDVAVVAATTAPALTKVDSSVIIRRGDTLWQISRRIYGRGVRYSTIYLANKQKVEDPNKIWPGQVMMIPEKTTEGEAADMAEVEKRKSETASQ